MAGRIEWKCRDRALVTGGRPLIMGILNVTPDSFSDGGKHVRFEDAVRHGMQMVKDGADIVDVGGESTRPGAAEVSEAEELARVIPVIKELARSGAAVSVDTMKSGVARQALDAGAGIINDVSALSHDPQMAAVAKDHGAGVVLMHMLGTPRTMQNNPQYANVVAEVTAYLARRIEALAALGIRPETMAVDPGIGFGKTVEHNLSLLAHLDELCGLGHPVVVGLSRKSFLGKITGCEVGERLAPSIAGLSFSILRGAHVLRVHDVKESRQAAEVIFRLAGS